MNIASRLYEQDLYAWTKQQVELLETNRLSELDTTSLIEELYDMSGSTRRELVNRLGVLLAHLLKWYYQPEHRSASWSGTVKEQRRKLQRLLKENPSIKALALEKVQDAYGDALTLVEKDTGLDENHFPEICPFSLEQALSNEYWPCEIIKVRG